LHTRTKRSFGYQWLRYRVSDNEENRQHFYRRTGTQPSTLPGQLFFEAGCGMGRYLKVIGEQPGAEVVGLDLSLAVNRARAENRSNPRVHLIQGNILELPLRPECFDHVYSIGVLHHTPSTEEAFKSIVKLVKPGGRVSIWVYHLWGPPGQRGFKALHARLRGRVSDTLRLLTTRLPHPVLHYLCYVAAPLGWIQMRIRKLPAPLRLLLLPLTLLPVSPHPEWRVRLCDTFDWYSPRYQWKHSVEEAAGWFEDAGLADISTTGFAVSVRGRKPAPDEQSEGHPGDCPDPDPQILHFPREAAQAWGAVDRSSDQLIGDVGVHGNPIYRVPGVEPGIERGRKRILNAFGCDADDDRPSTDQ